MIQRLHRSSELSRRVVDFDSDISTSANTRTSISHKSPYRASIKYEFLSYELMCL